MCSSMWVKALGGVHVRLDNVWKVYVAPASSWYALVVALKTGGTQELEYWDTEQEAEDARDAFLQATGGLLNPVGYDEGQL